jgi:hypothetical protein
MRANGTEPMLILKLARPDFDWQSFTVGLKPEPPTMVQCGPPYYLREFNEAITRGNVDKAMIVGVAEGMDEYDRAARDLAEAQGEYICNIIGRVKVSNYPVPWDEFERRLDRDLMSLDLFATLEKHGLSVRWGW